MARKLLLLACFIVPLAPGEGGAQEPGLARLEGLIDELNRSGVLSRGEITEGSLTLGRKKSVAAFSERLRHSDKSVRVLALIDLLRTREPAAAEPIAKALRDSEPIVRRVAARCVGLLGTPDAAKRLLGSIQDDHALVRASVMDGFRDLVATAPKRAPDMLREAFRAASDPASKATLATLITELGPDAAPLAPDLIEALVNESKPVRVAAGKALAAIGEGATPLLVLELSDSGSPRRAQAAKVLGSMGRAATSAALPLLWAAHEAPPSTAREPARKALAKLRQLGGVIPALLESEDLVFGVRPSIPGHWIVSASERAQIERSFSLAGRPELALEELPALLETGSPQVKRAVLWALEDVGPSARDAIASDAALDTANDEIRLEAIRALARLGPGSAGVLGAAITHEAAHHKGRSSRLAIVKILGLYGPRAGPAADDLAVALGDSDPGVRQEAKLVLAALGTQAVSSVPTLVRLSSDDDPTIHESARELLSQLGTKLKAQGNVLWWVVPWVYWKQLALFALFVLAVCLGGLFSRRPEPLAERLLVFAGLPVVVVCPLVYLLFSRQWVQGFLPDALPSLLPLPLVVTLSTGVCVGLLGVWSATRRPKSIEESLRVQPRGVQGFRLARSLQVRLREVLPIRVRPAGPDAAPGDSKSSPIRTMSPEARPRRRD